MGWTRWSAELGSATVIARTLDVADEEATRALVERDQPTRSARSTSYFANAGVATGGGPEAPNEVWDKQWQVNVMSHVYASRALFPGWTERGAGHLVTTASMAGILTSLGDGVYSATKHAALGLAEWLAITYADKGIRVSCICPGAVDTAMLRAGGGGDAAKASAIIGGGDVTAAVGRCRAHPRRAWRGPLPDPHPSGDARIRGRQGGGSGALDSGHDAAVVARAVAARLAVGTARG